MRLGRKPAARDGENHAIWPVLTRATASNPQPDTAAALAGLGELRAICKSPDAFLAWALRLLALHRSVVIQQRLQETMGTSVQSGPFTGMRLRGHSREGGQVPKLLGCYEADLHGEWERVVRRDYATVVNVGCADGYYAVGLARRMPRTRILAYDSDSEARQSCGELAELNGVADRIEIRGSFTGKEFAALPAADVFVICDIEGYERELLDPARFPRLKGMDLLVEMHDLAAARTDRLLRERFVGTHTFSRVDATLGARKLPVAFAEQDELDRLLAVWEWRIEPTPWAIMLAREDHERRREDR